MQGVDTRLWIYSGNCGALIPIDNNDDTCLMDASGGDACAYELLAVPVTAGVTYYIEWDDFGLPMDSSLQFNKFFLFFRVHPTAAGS